MGEVFYEMGEYDQALSLFREGDDEGNPDCSAWLGRLDIEHGSAGKGVQTLRNALDRGSSLAGLFLGDYYYGQKNYSTALQYYHKAANRNVGPALLKLGRMYFDGEGTPKKYTSARIFLERAWDASSSTIDTDCGNYYPQKYPGALSCEVYQMFKGPFSGPFFIFQVPPQVLLGYEAAHPLCVEVLTASLQL